MIFAAALLAALAPQDPPPTDFSAYDPACGVRVERRGSRLEASWDAGGVAYGAAFDLAPGAPLLARLTAGGAVLARGVRPVYAVTAGSRAVRPAERYIFFDKPASRPHARHEAALEPGGARVEGAGRRARVVFPGLSAGPFRGELAFSFYAGSPLVHVEAVLTPGRPQVAYIYDALLEGEFGTFAWKDVEGRFVREAPAGEPRPIAARHRAILAESEAGTLAAFPPPHAFFFPRDHTDNFGFVQAGRRRFGLRQDPDRKNAFVPWFDAPEGRAQRMGLFVLLHAGRAEEALERVLRYTRGDRFARLEGRQTFTSHWHLRLTVAERAGRPRAPEVVRVFKDMGVDIVHLAEFHGDPGAHRPDDPGPRRLPELRAMFDLCRRYSDHEILLLPGEEANMRLNMPPPPGTHPGHWMYLFPRPVYFLGVRPEGTPFEERIEPYGRVYRAGNEEEMVEILRREGALAWTAHPRIKASFACPDSYRHKEWFRSDLWLGGTWKAMPADLSHRRLGVRSLDLLDDMNTWGPRKYVLGEVDTFELDRTHELYGHMNINYLRLSRRPAPDDGSPVLEALRRGDFFVTTGEVLIRSFEVRDGRARADLEWTFPLDHARIASWDGREVRHRVLPLAETGEFGRAAFEWPLEGGDVRWARLEVWDVAANGAFTQPVEPR
jgi:hypothetical protein